jgi:TolA-binding protein
MSRLISRGMTGRIKIRISRAWRGYKVGDVIQPVGALRQQLLRQTDQLGNKIAEVVNETSPAQETFHKTAEANAAALQEMRGGNKKPKAKAKAKATK